MMLVEDKVAIVSGVGGGMGKEIAFALARQGADVVLAARTATTLKEFAQEIEQETGRRVLPVATDFTSGEARAHLVSVVADTFGHLDILVNNAAHPGNYKALMDTRLDSWRKTMEINFFSTLELTRLVVPLMHQREGRIVMINSTAGLYPKAAGGAYGASKAALVAITRVLAQELGQAGIRVNSLHPGPIWGEHWIEYYQGEARRLGVEFDSIVAEHSAKSPLGYIPDAKEIAGVAVFLASDLARAVTGQSIVVDCGTSL
jgi:NAD(P)-dependent dehydrogenase (short-subunit alcohol dehydrogenase family)